MTTRFFGALFLTFALLAYGADSVSQAMPPRLLWVADSLPGGRSFEAVSLLAGGDGSLYASDAGRCRLLRFDTAGRFINDAGGCGSGPFRLGRPGGLVRRTGFGLFLCDPDHGRILQFDEALNPLSTFTPRPPGAAPFSPFAAAASREGTLYVGDPVSGRVLALGRDGAALPLLPNSLPGAPLSIKPRALAFADRIYLYDENIRALHAFDRFGAPLMVFGRDRPVADFGLTVFGDSLLLASDPGAGLIRVYTPGGREIDPIRLFLREGPFRPGALTVSRDRLYAARVDGRVIACFRMAP